MHEDPTTTDHFKSVFSCTVDPMTVGAQARLSALSVHLGMERTRAVNLVRIEYVNYHPAPWRQSRPHWGLEIGDDIYHVLVVPRVEGDLQSASCTLAWVLAHGMPVGERHPLGTTALCHEQVIAALCHVLSAFGGDDGIDTLFWHCGDFLRTAAAALCGGDIEAATHDGDPAVDEVSLRDGLFALGRRDRVAPIGDGDSRDDLIRSRAAIARTLCVDEPSWFDGCVLA